MRQQNSSDIAKWVSIETSLCPDFIRARIGSDSVRELATTFVEESLNRIFQPDFAEMQYSLCKIPGTVEQHYRYRQIDTPFGKIITSIRFIGGDLSKPAVFIMHNDFNITGASQIHELGNILKDAYAIFRPQRFRWFAPENGEEIIKANHSVRGDMIHVTEFTANIKKLPPPVGFDRIELRPAVTLDWYPVYKATYERIFEQWPAFSEMAQPESRDALQGLMDESLLFEVYIDRNLAGIIGARTCSEYFFKGFVVIEELLFDAFRGQGFALAVQRRLIELLPDEDHNMIFGTIHFENKPSLRTALRVGRKQTGMFLLAEI